ncbi:hypothetical protein AYI68_g7550 [Smittium mucronatum]|uniref:Uncharacterized protein n=1 Tax=Smittium mucronatum TaxID=133383 RepID=A0A1R0GND3_9FUNG|nr:hypothetical protein AYI68_g7550 [Smittium mucronatum]
MSSPDKFLTSNSSPVQPLVMSVLAQYWCIQAIFWLGRVKIVFKLFFGIFYAPDLKYHNLELIIKPII